MDSGDLLDRGYARRIAKRLIGQEISVIIASDVTWPFAATYGARQLTFNLVDWDTDSSMVLSKRKMI